MGIDRGEFDPSLDPEIAARALFPGGDGTLIIHLALGEEERAPAVLLAYLEIMLRGMAAPKVPRSGGEVPRSAPPAADWPHVTRRRRSSKGKSR